MTLAAADARADLTWKTRQPRRLGSVEKTSSQRRALDPPTHRISRMPPGLQIPLAPLLSGHNPWVKLGEPIRLFEYLHQRFGPISSYKLPRTRTIVFMQRAALTSARSSSTRRGSFRQGAHPPANEDPPRRRPHHLRRSHSTCASAGSCRARLPSPAHRRIRPGVHRRHCTRVRMHRSLAARTNHRRQQRHAGALPPHHRPAPCSIPRSRPTSSPSTTETNIIMGLYNFLVAMPMPWSATSIYPFPAS